MIPALNQPYLFTLNNEFSSLNGVYIPIKSMSFETALQDEQVNFLTSLYTPAGLTQTNFNTDYPTFQGQTVYEVQTPSPTPTTYYFPETIFASIPDPSVQRYQNIYLNINIGAFADPTVYGFLLNQVQDMVCAFTGVARNAEWKADPAADVWLTSAQYNALAATRQANATAINPLSTQLQNALALLSSAQTRIAALEAIVASIATPA